MFLYEDGDLLKELLHSAREIWTRYLQAVHDAIFPICEHGKYGFGTGTFFNVRGAFRTIHLTFKSGPSNNRKPVIRFDTHMQNDNLIWEEK
jgi:hypothetical protein